MRKKMKKPFAYLLVLFLLMSSVCNRGIFVLADSVDPSQQDSSIVVEETKEKTAENSFTSGQTEETTASSAQNEPAANVSQESDVTSDDWETTGKGTIPETVIVEYLPVSQPSGIQVKAYAAEGVLPEGTVMTVIALEEGSEEYSAAEEALNHSDVEFDGFKALDISFYDAAGNVIEPQDGSVQVCIEVDAALLPEEVNTDSLAVQHLDESTGEIEVKTVAETAGGTVEANEAAVTAEFSVESFSIFTLTWNGRNSLSIICIDEEGTQIGENKTGNITTATPVTDIAPKFSGYEFVNATVGDTVIQRIQRNSRSWQYSTSSSGSWNWTNISGNQVYFNYRALGPTVELSQSVSADTVTLTASTRNFTSTPTLTWSISGDTDAVEFDPVNHTVTWKEDAAEGAVVTVTVDAAAVNGQQASASIILKNEFVTITYNPNTSRGGSGTTAQVRYRVGETITVPGNTFGFTNTQSRTFGGWGTETNTSSGETNKVYTPGQMLTITGNMLLYAQWIDSDATVNHMDIRIEGVTFSRVVEIVDGEGNVINRATQTFTGTVTSVTSAKIEGYNGFTHDYNKGPYTSNSYEFRLGSFTRQSLSNIKTVTAVVTITGDDGTVLENQTVTFNEAQIYAAWANCGNSRTGKGMDFNVSSANIELKPERIPARLIVTKDFVGLDASLVSQLNDFVIDVNGQKLTINDPAQRTVTIGGENVIIVKAIEADGTYMWALTNLPAGSYTVTETGGETVNEYELHKSTFVVSAYNSNDATNSGTGKTTTVTLGSGDVKVAAFTNTYGKQQADLTITKEVEGAEVSEGTTFTFDVYKEGADLASDDPVDTVVLPTQEGKMTDIVRLEVGEYIIVETGGEITNYNHISTAYTSAGEITDNQDATANVKLPVNGLTVTCTNTYEKAVNDLTITKAVQAENDGEINVSGITYSFKVKGADDLTGTYILKKADGTNGQVVFTNGEATVEIKGTGTVEIKDLPVGSYNVTETKPTADPNGYYFDESTILTGNATLTKNNADSVTITNKYIQERKLTVSKTVGGSMGDTNKRFSFTIKVNDKVIDGIYGNVTITNGTFTLAHGESVEITGLKISDNVEITEDNYSSDGYTTTVNEENGRVYTTNSSGLESVTTNVDYVNTKDVSAPTGIFRNIFPFIMMVVVAVDAAIVFFVMYMRRKRY